MKHRIFIGLPLPQALQLELEKLERKIRKKFPVKIPWQPFENIHLTLIFIGWVESEQVEKVKQLLRESSLKNQSESGLVEKIDYGPPSTHRMIWLYLRPNQFLNRLKIDLEQELNANSIPFVKETHKFLPHCTLARLKTIIKTKLPDILQPLNLPVDFERLTLFESILQKPFPRYIELDSVTLS